MCPFFQEFLTYAKAYRQALSSTREKAGVLLTEACGPTYSSKAYFEK